MFNNLSPREQEVLNLVLKGFSNAEIADLLEVTERTIKAHVGTIFVKTGCPNRNQLFAEVIDRLRNT